MNATERARRSDSLYFDNVSRRELCDKIAFLESDMQDMRKGPDHNADGLLPCPFCGGDAVVMHMDYGDGYLPEVQTVWGVWCRGDMADEYAHGHCIENYATKEDAIAAWNRRAK